MQWFYDLKISKKLIGSFLIVSFISVLIVWLGILRLKSISEQDKYMYQNCVISIQDLGTVSSKFELAMALTRDPVLITDESLKQANINARNALTKVISENLKDYETRISTPEEKELYNKFLDARKAFRTQILKFNAFLAEGNLKQAALFFQGDFIVASENQRVALQRIIQFKTDYAKSLSLSNEEQASAAIRDLIILAIIGFVVSIGLGLFIANIIKRPVAKVLDMAKELLKGHVKARANIKSKDELGEMGKVLDEFAVELEDFTDSMNLIADGDVSVKLEIKDKDDVLTPALNNIAETLRTLLTETKLLINGAIDGKLSIRGDANKFKGGYKDIVTGINATLDAVIGPLNMAAEYVDRIAKGDIPKKISDQYNGDFNELKNNLNGCIDAINLLISDVYSLSAGTVEGKLGTRAETNRHQGDFKKIVEGMNGTLDAVTGPLYLAANYMINISKGIIPEKISEEYKGDFNDIKTSINDLISSTNLILTGINRISVSVIEGDLSDRCNVELVVGSWRTLLEEVNSIVNPLVTNIQFMAKNINDIAKGDIPEKITGNYKGDFNVIKNNLNTCIDAINNLVTDADSLSRAAIEGKLAVRADVSKHQGDFRKIVEGVNNTLDAVITPLTSAANYIEIMKKGEMIEPIQETFPGDFEAIKININDLYKINSMFFTGVDTMVKNIKNGNLDYRGNADLFAGSWKNLAISINTMSEVSIDSIRFMAENINKIAKGQIPEKITDEYKGEFNDVKNNLNTCFDAISLLIHDMNILSESALEGKLERRADASKHNGDFSKIIKGINDTLDSVLAPVKEGVGYLGKMATGDLTERITSDYKGDHQLIKNSINSVAESLSKAMNDVSEAIQATASASNQISSSTEEMAAGASEQTQQATEVAGAVEEMTKTILENTRNASFAAETAKDAGNKAVEGGKVVSETIEGMNRIAEVVRKSAKTVNELGKSSDQIGEIVQVIDDIADQTNLLALNAAIEAARAGEQGRGFAVVADEVRKLAERTTKATKEIAAMIKQIQKDTVDAVASMEEGTKEVELGKQKADKAGDSLKEIIAGASKVVDIVTQVAAASEEQSSAAEEISKSIEAISSVTQQSASGTQQIARAAEDLNRLTLNLRKSCKPVQTG